MPKALSPQDPLSEETMTEDQLLDALRDCFDPEIPLNIVDLGLVASTSLTPDPEAPGSGIPGVPARYAVTVTLLPKQADEAHDAQLRALIHNRLAGIFELCNIRILLADAPAWTPTLITPAGRHTLGLDRPHFPILNNRIDNPMPPPAKTKPRKPIPIHAPKPAPVHPFDAAHATDTGGLIPRAGLLTGHPNDAHLTAYYAVAPSILDALIDLWLQTRPTYPIGHTTFLDIGAGKGRALMSASLHPFRDTVGVELNPTMASIARANLAVFAESASPLAPARIVEADILDSPLPEGPTLGFMFHPFEAPLVRRLLRHLEAHYTDTPFDLLYVNAEHASVLDQSPRWRRIFHGTVAMSAQDHLADLAEIAEQQEYGSTGDEICTIYRLQPTSHEQPEV